MEKGILKVYLRGFVSVRREGFLPRLIVHEKYENIVKWSLRLLTASGVVASAFTFPAWYYSFTFAVVLVLFQQFLERTVFQFTTIYVQPFASFEYKPEEWRAMGFMLVQDPDPSLLHVIGPAFVTREYAHEFFSLLREWNYHNRDDRDDNICISIIVENLTEYSFYMYPNTERPSVKQFFDELAQQGNPPGRELQQLVVNEIFCKTFPYGGASRALMFVRQQSRARPFWIQPFLIDENNQLKLLFDEEPILKHSFKFRRRDELTPQELEYWHGKTVMGL